VVGNCELNRNFVSSKLFSFTFACVSLPMKSSEFIQSLQLVSVGSEVLGALLEWYQVPCCVALCGGSLQYSGGFRDQCKNLSHKSNDILTQGHM